MPIKSFFHERKDYNINLRVSLGDYIKIMQLREFFRKLYGKEIDNSKMVRIILNYIYGIIDQLEGYLGELGEKPKDEKFLKNRISEVAGNDIYTPQIEQISPLNNGKSLMEGLSLDVTNESIVTALKDFKKRIKNDNI